MVTAPVKDFGVHNKLYLTLHISSFQQLSKRYAITLLLEIRKLQSREVKWLAQGHNEGTEMGKEPNSSNCSVF
jgi:hypothetical protein